MKYYFKKIGLVFLYFALTAITGIMISGTTGVTEEGEIVAWTIIKFVMSLVNLSVFILSIIIMFYREGETAYKQLGTNDIMRQRMIETGKDIPIKRAEEYRAWKGFVLPLFIFIPMVILLVIHLIVGCTSGYTNNTFGVISSFIYMAFYSPVFTFAVQGTIQPTAHFATLYAIPLTSVIAGVAYIVGAKKRKKAEEFIENKNSAIHGEKK